MEVERTWETIPWVVERFEVLLLINLTALPFPFAVLSVSYRTTN